MVGRDWFRHHSTMTIVQAAELPRGPGQTLLRNYQAQLSSRGVIECRRAGWWLLRWWRLARCSHCAVQQSSTSATCSPRFIWCAIELQSDRGHRFLSHLTSPFWKKQRERSHYDHYLRVRCAKSARNALCFMPVMTARGAVRRGAAQRGNGSFHRTDQRSASHRSFYSILWCNVGWYIHVSLNAHNI